MTSDKSTADFEKALTELEDLVRRMEQGELSLEQSLQAFERGIRLTRECQDALRTAELRVQKLIHLDDGSTASVPFEEAGNEQ